MDSGGVWTGGAYDGGLDEPSAIADGVEEGEGFLHSVLGRRVSGWRMGSVGCTYDALVLVQHLIVLAQRDEEDQGGDVLEAVNPLLSL